MSDQNETSSQVKWVRFWSVLAVLALAFAVIVTFYYVLREPWSPLNGYTNPQVLTERQDVYRPGDILQMSGTKCSSDDEPVNVKVSATWKRLHDGGLMFKQYLDGYPLTFPAGCKDYEWRNTIPDLPSGEWQISGIDTVVRGSETQTKVWQTESFQIVAP